MAAIYGNIIKELIVQSRLNGQLLNEVNNKLHDNDLNFADVREHHIQRVEQEYQNLHLDRIYDYFDGTNLINSLFSTVVVPIEYLKGRFKRQFNNAGTYKNMMIILGI